MSASPKRKPAKATWLKLARQRTGYWQLTLQYPMIALMTLTLLIPGALKPQYVLNEDTIKLSQAEIPNPRHRCAQSWSMWAAP